MGLEMAVRDMERSDEEESDDELQTLKGVCLRVFKYSGKIEDFVFIQNHFTSIYSFSFCVSYY